MKRIIPCCLIFFLTITATEAQIDSVYTPARYIHTASKFSIEQAFAQISAIDSATFYAEDVSFDLSGKEELDASFINERLKAVDALDYLKKIIATHQIIIINEAHNSPQHRLLINELLNLMPEHSIYAYEGLIDTSAQLSRDKVPLVVQKGYTSNQAQMAEIFRTAKKKSMEIFQYEDINASCYDTLHRYANAVRLINKCDPYAQICDVDPELYALIKDHYRDYVQGSNLANKIRANPGRKILIHCGYGHAMKRKGSMEEFVRMCTGYKPFVIEQTTFNSHQHPELDLALYNTNIDSSVKKPVILVGADDTAMQLRKTNQGLADLYVFYPRYEKRDGRFTNIICDECKLANLTSGSFAPDQYTVLVKVYRQDEYDKYKTNVVPSDVFEISSYQESVGAVLRDGDYICILSPSKGKAETVNIIIGR